MSIFEKTGGALPGVARGHRNFPRHDPYGDDTELVRMPVEGHIWTGIIGHPVGVAVAGDATNPNGDTVYNEGAFSGEVAATVQNNNQGIP